jgi:hypothetical protein
LRSSHSVARLNPPRCYPRREPLLLARLPERRGEDAGGAGALAQGETYRNRHDALFNRDKATAHSLGQPRALTRPDRLESARGRRTDEHPLADHHLCHHPAPITHHDSVSRKCASCALDLMDLVILFWSFPQQNDLRRPPAADEPSVDLTCSLPGVCQPARLPQPTSEGVDTDPIHLCDARNLHDHSQQSIDRKRTTKIDKKHL